MKAYIKIVLLLIAFSAILSIETSPEPQTESEKEAYKTMMLQMTQEESEGLNDMLLRQIFIWTGIGLFAVLYFSVMAMVDMPIQKSSILYAKYGTSRAQQEIH